MPHHDPITILHLADLHLDRAFVGLAPEDARVRRRELRDALDRCLALAAERRVDAITIGGDLWEDEHLTPDTARWVADRLERARVPVVLVAGNHDPLRPGGPHRRLEWPPNVHLFAAEAGLRRHDLGALSIWGISWGAAPLTAEELHRFAVPDDGRVHVLLLHGTAGRAASERGAHCPFGAEEVRAAGFQLCLAGHLHSGGIRDGVVVYPGSPEPLAWDETGRHAVALVELSPDARPRVQLIDVNSRRCAEAVVDCHGATCSAEVERALRAAVARVATDGGGRGYEGLCLRAVLRGRVHPECRIDTAELAATVQRPALLALRDETQPAFDLDVLAAQPTALGAFVRELRRRIAVSSEHGDSEQSARLELALELGLRAMHGEELARAA